MSLDSDFIEGGYIIDAFMSFSGYDLELMEIQMAGIIADTCRCMRASLLMDYDRNETWAEQEGVSKGQFGNNCEKRITRIYDMPWKAGKATTATCPKKIAKAAINNPLNLLLDTMLYGKPVDIKTTFGGQNFMVPKECYSHWCMLVKVDYDNLTFDLGFVRAVEENLRFGLNGDKKNSFSAAGMQEIQWILRKSSFA